MTHEGAMTPQPPSVRRPRGGASRGLALTLLILLGASAPAWGAQDGGDAPEAKGDKITATVHGHLQFRHTAAPAFDDPSTAADESEGDMTNSFDLRRARVWVDARLGGFKLRTKVAVESGAFRLLSAWAERDLPLGFELRAGQLKRMISMDYIISSPHTRLLDRSLASDESGAKRDIGLRLSRPLWRKRIQPMIAVFNGNGANMVANDNDSLRLEARLDATPLGKYDLEKANVGSKPRVMVGGAFGWWKKNAVRKAAAPGDTSGSGDRYVLTEEDAEWIASLHAAARYRGVEVRGEYYRRQSDPVDAEDSARTAMGVTRAQHEALLSTYDRGRDGMYGQIAWRLPWAKQLEVAGRYGVWHPDRDDAARSTERISTAVGWRPHGDRVKLQGGWQQTRERAKDTKTATTWAWTTQLQLLF